jgi:hypothetical protein
MDSDNALLDLPYKHTHEPSRNEGTNQAGLAGAYTKAMVLLRAPHRLERIRCLSEVRWNALVHSHKPRLQDLQNLEQLSETLARRNHPFLAYINYAECRLAFVT